MFPLRKLSELPPKTRLRKAALILRGLELELAAGREPDGAYLKGLHDLCRGDLARLAGGTDMPRVAGIAGMAETPRPETPVESDGAGVRRREMGGDTGKMPASAAETGGGEERSPARAASRGPCAPGDEDAFPDPGALRTEDLPRFLNNLRHEILSCLGAEPAEWDFLDHEKGTLDPASRLVLPMRVYLEDIRSPYNVGSMFRTAEAFGVEHIYISPRTPSPTHPRAAKTARGCEKIVGWSTAGLGELNRLEGTDGVFALELGGTPLDEFMFPKRGVVLVGSEELGLSPEALELAESGAGRVSIPLAGAKRSLNVASAFAILMQKWYEVFTGKSGK